MREKSVTLPSFLQEWLLIIDWLITDWLIEPEGEECHPALIPTGVIIHLLIDWTRGRGASPYPHSYRSDYSFIDWEECHPALVPTGVIDWLLIDRTHVRRASPGPRSYRSDYSFIDWEEHHPALVPTAVIDYISINWLLNPSVLHSALTDLTFITWAWPYNVGTHVRLTFSMILSRFCSPADGSPSVRKRINGDSGASRPCDNRRTLSATLRTPSVTAPLMFVATVQKETLFWCKTLAEWRNCLENKDSLQWDAYRMLVDRIPACTGGVSANPQFTPKCPPHKLSHLWVNPPPHTFPINFRFDFITSVSSYLVWFDHLNRPTPEAQKLKFLMEIIFYFGGHNSFYGATDTPVLDFWWRLPWVSRLPCLCTMSSHSHLVWQILAARLFQSMYLRTSIGKARVRDLSVVLSVKWHSIQNRIISFNRLVIKSY